MQQSYKGKFNTKNKTKNQLMKRINLTKKDIINSIYMQIGFSKNISENLLEDFLNTIADNLKINKKLKISKFGTFSIRNKKKKNW